MSWMSWSDPVLVLDVLVRPGSAGSVLRSSGFFGSYNFATMKVFGTDE